MTQRIAVTCLWAEAGAYLAGRTERWSVAAGVGVEPLEDSSGLAQGFVVGLGLWPAEDVQCGLILVDHAFDGPGEGVDLGSDDGSATYGVLDDLAGYVPNFTS